MNVYQSSLIGNEADEEEKAGFERIADVMIDPAVETCMKAGEEKQRLRPSWDQPIFVLNCLTHLQVCSLCHSWIIVHLMTSQSECPRSLLVHYEKASMAAGHYR